MKSRCYNPNIPTFHHYGGKGILVCDEWLNDFYRFVDDMGARPNSYTLDRINSSLGYSKENCRWASKLEQCLNRGCVKNPKKIFITRNGNYRAYFRLNTGKQLTKTFKTEVEALEWYENNKPIYSC